MTGENMCRKEAVYLVGDSVYLYLKQSSSLDAIAYETYDRKTGGIQRKGEIPFARMESDPIKYRMACARILVQEELGLKDAKAGEVAVSTLDSLKDAKTAYRREHAGALHDYSIPFVNTRGEVLFRLKNGGTAEFHYPHRTFASRCENAGKDRVRVGDTVYKNTELADLLEKRGGSVRPEPEIESDRAAWRLSQEEYQEFLLIRRTEYGSRYEFITGDYQAVSCGRIEDPDLTMIEAREEILRDWNRGRHGIGRRYTTDYEKVYREMMLKQREYAAEYLKTEDKDDIRFVESKYDAVSGVKEYTFKGRIFGEQVTVKHAVSKDGEGRDSITRPDGTDRWEDLGIGERLTLSRFLLGIAEQAYWQGQLDEAGTAEEVRCVRFDFAMSVGNEYSAVEETFMTWDQVCLIQDGLEKKEKELKEERLEESRLLHQEMKSVLKNLETKKLQKNNTGRKLMMEKVITSRV